MSTAFLIYLLQQESYDYIGSSRMVYDMRHGQFPYKPDNDTSQPAFVDVDDIAYYIELKQLGLAEDGKLYAHTDPITQEDQHTKQQVNIIHLSHLPIKMHGSTNPVHKYVHCFFWFQSWHTVLCNLT